MSKFRVVLVLIAVVGLLPSRTVRAAESPTAEQARLAGEVRKKLSTPCNFGGFDDSETKLDDVFHYFRQSYGVTLEINDQAFQNEGIENVLDRTLGKALPKMVNVAPELALQRILLRIPSTSGATFVVRGGTIEITTRQAASPSTWQLAPHVSIAFEKRPLAEALQEMADGTGVNIVLDARAGELGKMPVTATMRGVGVDTVVQLLANMADLRTLPVGNVLYVTTRDNAKVLRGELQKLETVSGDMPKANKAQSTEKKTP
jgi:hypothetical protein